MFLFVSLFVTCVKIVSHSCRSHGTCVALASHWCRTYVPLVLHSRHLSLAHVMENRLHCLTNAMFTKLNLMGMVIGYTYIHA